MNIVLLAHSHVGNGVDNAISRRTDTKLLLTAGYLHQEQVVPSPNLLDRWHHRGETVARIDPARAPDYEDFPVGDILISANWRHKIPETYFSQFPLAVNFHGANTHLTRYRGRSPIQRQIADGQRAYFLTCHRLAEQYDAGEILAQTMVRFPQVPTQHMVYYELGNKAYDLTLWILDHWNDLAVAH